MKKEIYNKKKTKKEPKIPLIKKEALKPYLPLSPVQKIPAGIPNSSGPNDSHFKEGSITITAKGTGYVRVQDSEDEDIEIAQRFLNTALHGDRVRVFLHPEKEGERQTGEVTEILMRHKMTFIGKIERKGNLVFLIADDRHMYTDIYIANEKSMDAKDGQKVFARIISWTDPKKNPSGEVLKVLGLPGDHETEMEAIVLEKGFQSTFSPEVLASAEVVSGKITEEEVAKRRDIYTGGENITVFVITKDGVKELEKREVEKYLQ